MLALRDLCVEAGSIGEVAKERTSRVFPGHTHSWEDIAFLKKYCDGLIVLKGIQTVGDAKLVYGSGCSRHCSLES